MNANAILKNSDQMQACKMQMNMNGKQLPIAKMSTPCRLLTKAMAIQLVLIRQRLASN